MKLKFADVLDLDKLPYFKKTSDGNNLYFTGSDGNFIDFHTHVGGRYFLSRNIDWFRESETKTFFPNRGVPLDFNGYSATNFPKKMIPKIRLETLRPAVITP